MAKKAVRTAASLGLVSLTACGVPTAQRVAAPEPALIERTGTVLGYGDYVQDQQERWYAEVKRQREHRWYGGVYWAKVARWHEGWQRHLADVAAAEARVERAEARFRAARTQVDALRAETAPSRTAERLVMPYAGDAYAIPTAIVMCESGGDYQAENPTSTASGAYQIVDGTWAGFAGYSHASDAPPAVQDERAAQIWNGGAGRGHWVC